MILSAQIMPQPVSGKYPEQIFEGPLSTQGWTWVKFEDEYYNEFYGQFHGTPNCVALSIKNAACYVLTDAFLYEIDCNNLSNYQVRDFWECNCKLQNVTFLPNGTPLFSDDYELFTINKSFDDKFEIKNPVHVDYIKFDYWEDNLLYINAKTFEDMQPIQLILDANTMRITVNK